MGARSSRIFRVLRAGGLIAVNTLLVLGLLEAALRWGLGVERLRVGAMAALAGADILPEKITPIAPAAFLTDAQGFLVAGQSFPGVNGAGFRTPAFDEVIHGARKTVLLIGDSFTWGYSAAPLEACFADRVRDAGYRAINLGIPSAGPAQYAASAERFVPQLKPDAVCVLLYAGNDIISEPEVRPGFARRLYTNAGLLQPYDARGEPLAYEAAVAQFQGLLGADARSRFTRALRATSLGTIVHGLAQQGGAMTDASSFTQACMQRIRAACDAGHAKFLLFVLPAPASHYGGSNRVAEAVAVLQDFGPRSPQDFDESCFAEISDEHFNNEGHARMAAFVLEELAREGLPAAPGAVASPADIDPRRLRTLEELAAWLEIGRELLPRAREALNRLKDARARHFITGAGDDTPALAQLSAACQAELRALVHGEAAARLDALPAGTLEDIFTGHISFGQGILDPARAVQEQAVGLQREADGGIRGQELLRVLAADAEQAAAITQALERLREDFLALLKRPSADGGPAPLSIAASGAPADFDAALRTKSPQGELLSYLALMKENDTRTRATVMATLRPEQRDLLRAFDVESLLDITLEHDPVEAALQDLAAKTGAGQTTIDWTTFRARLNLKAAQLEPVRKIINDLKDAYRALQMQAAADGERTRQLELTARRALIRLLDDAQQRRLERLNLGSLADVDTGPR